MSTLGVLRTESSHRKKPMLIAQAFFHYRYDGPIENMENKFIRLALTLQKPAMCPEW